MSKFSLASFAVGVVLVSCALCAPTQDHLKMALADVLDSAVCPIRVYIDEKKDRVPQRIKMLKCATTPNPVCHEQGMTHACCRSHHRTFHTTCMEVTDTVLVRYKGSDELQRLDVSVGCTCVIQPEAQAREDR